MKLVVEIAKTDKEKVKGLSGRKKIPDNHGMLFVYKVSEQQSFWMKDTYIPLDLSFISDEGIIKEMHEMKPEDTYTIYSDGSYRLALETKKGILAKHGIGVGSRINLPTKLKEELKMASNRKIAVELVKLAKEIAADWSEEEGAEDKEMKQVLKKMDPALNGAVTRLLAVTKGDFGKMMTAIVMALKKDGHGAEASKVFSIFKTNPALKKVDKSI